MTAPFTNGPTGSFPYRPVDDGGIENVGWVDVPQDEGAEEWRAAPGFEGFYEVSSLGRVKSLARRIAQGCGASRDQPDTIMSPSTTADGYLRIVFRICGVLSTRAVHRLVCEAFHGPAPEGKPEVHHIDNARGNARADNLMWVSKAENHGFMDKAGEKNPFAKLAESDVRQIKASRDLGAKTLAARFGVKPGTIYDIWSGKRWSHLPFNPGEKRADQLTNLNSINNGRN